MKVPGPAIWQREPYPETLSVGLSIGAEQHRDERSGKSHLAESGGRSPACSEQLCDQGGGGERYDEEDKLGKPAEPSELPI
jgi:hypothetical protein